ncbi:hypothetical protein DFJ77DRAFT_18150 [Powellomyces hirtus]|nr:hypothetical protein DFJ77DRAFT_18150 [Powellomyces hirtus]
MGKRGGAHTAKQKKIKKSLHSKGSHKHGQTHVEPGMQGIYCFVSMDRERQAVTELRNVFGEYMEKLYGPQEKMVGEDSDSEEGDVSDLLDKELAQLKNAPTDKKQQFEWRKTNMDCIVFLRTHAPVEPVELVHRLLSDLDQSKQKMTRYTQRLHPVQSTCRPYVEDIKVMAKKLLAPHFHAEGGTKGIKWAIESRIKWNDNITREEVIEAIADVVGTDHVVNLKQPELTIVVDILKNVCGMSVVRDYPEFKKYNLEKINEVEAPKKQPEEDEREAQASNKRKADNDDVSTGEAQAVKKSK